MGWPCLVHARRPRRRHHALDLAAYVRQLLDQILQLAPVAPLHLGLPGLGQAMD